MRTTKLQRARNASIDRQQRLRAADVAAYGPAVGWRIWQADSTFTRCPACGRGYHAPRRGTVPVACPDCGTVQTEVKL